MPPRQGWDVVEIYQDVMSGAKASRPALNRLMTDAYARKFDCLLVWKLDRFGRSLGGLPQPHPHPRRHGVRFIAVTQNLDTDIKNPASRFLLHVLAAAAEFERALICERTQAGRLRYKQDYEAGRVGNGVYSCSGRNLPPHGWAGCSNTIAAPHEYFDHTGYTRYLAPDALRAGTEKSRQSAPPGGAGTPMLIRSFD